MSPLLLVLLVAAVCLALVGWTVAMVVALTLAALAVIGAALANAPEA